MSTALEALQARRDQFEEELERIENKVYDEEGRYLGSDFCQCGTVVKGFEGYLSSKDALRKRQRIFKVEDRAFSLSSVSSPATTELERDLAEAANDVMGGLYGRGKGKGKGFGKGGMAAKGNRR